MNDAGSIIRTALLTQTALTAVIGTRLWAERSTPIADYKPDDGGAIAFRMRGGGVMYRAGLMFPSVQFKCWGVDEFTANSVYRTLFDVLHDQAFGGIRSAYMEVLGQTVLEQDTEWPFVLTFFTIWLAV